jgi:hypothetical protein
MHGSRCFKCGGIGEVLTKRGRVAQAYLVALRQVPACALKVGDEIWVDGVPGMSSGKWGKIAEITRQPSPKGSSYPEEIVLVCPGVCTWHTFYDSPIRLRKTKGEAQELINRALEYQATLTKTGKERRAK